MVRICSHCVIERVLKIINRYRPSNYNNNIERITNNDIYDHNMECNNHNMECNRMNIKERIAELIKENEKYFICEVVRTTSDTILYDNLRDIERLKRLGYSHRIAAEIFEKHGIFLYTTDLSDYVYAPRIVKYELQVLINEYGLEKVAEEIAIYLKDNYSNQFGINIICTP